VAGKLPGRKAQPDEYEVAVAEVAKLGSSICRSGNPENGSNDTIPIWVRLFSTLLVSKTGFIQQSNNSI